MRFLLLALFASCATASKTKATQPEVELRFSRPEVLRMELTQTLEKVSDSTQTGHRADRQGQTLIETTQRKAPGQLVISRAVVGTPGLLAEFLVDEQGKMTGLGNMDEAVLLLSIQLGSKERARQQVEGPLRDDWATTAGAWAGLRYQVGEERTEPNPGPFFGKGELPQRVTTTFVGWVPCAAGALEARCVMLRARAQTQAQDVTPELLAELNRRSRSGEFKAMRADSVVELVTDPTTLIPVTKVSTKTIWVQLLSEGQLVEGTTVTTRTSSFRSIP